MLFIYHEYDYKPGTLYEHGLYEAASAHYRQLAAEPGTTRCVLIEGSVLTQFKRSLLTSTRELTNDDLKRSTIDSDDLDKEKI